MQSRLPCKIENLVCCQCWTVSTFRFCITVTNNTVTRKLSMGICQKKCHCGFSKSSKFKRVVLLVLMTFCVDVQVVNVAIRIRA